MRFRTAITLTILLALAAALLATVAVVSVVLDRAARHELTAELARDREALVDMLRYRSSLHRAESRVLADEPRLKAVVSTEDVTSATILGVLSDLRRALRCDLLLITDREGHLIADALHPEAQGGNLADNPAIAAALGSGEAEDVWSDGAQVFAVHARRLSFGATTVGVVVVGYRMDDALAESLGKHLGAGVALIQDRQVIATSRFESTALLDRRQLLSAVDAVAQGDSVQEVHLDGVRYLMTQAPLPEIRPEQKLRYAMFLSLDRALAPAQRLIHILYGVAAVALALALVAAASLSRRLVRPVDELVAFAQRIAAGDLKPARVDGLREVRTLSRAMDQMVEELAVSRVQVAEKTRLAKEMEIAERIQLSILPRQIEVNGLACAATMIPATEVGGDFYDVIPCEEGGCWIGVGDVAGHGLPAGLVMLMLQSAFASLAGALPAATPRQVVVLLNRILFDNVRNRLSSDEHVTFTAFRYFPDGKVVFAGAHESIVVLRRQTGSCELIETPGTWLGVVPNVESATTDSTIQLAVGDVMVLYTDGVTEAMNAARQQLGIDRLCAEVEACAGHSAAELHAHLMTVVRSFSATQTDDITLLVVCHEGGHGN